MTYTLTQKSPLLLLVELFKTELQLDDTQVKIASNNQPTPNLNRMYITLTDLNNEVIGTSNVDSATSTGMQRKVILWMKNDIQIDAYSKTSEVIERKSEIHLALQSYTAEQLKDSYGVSLQYNGNMHANFTQDVGNMLNRYTMTIPTYWQEQIEQDIPYFDTFSTREVIG